MVWCVTIYITAWVSNVRISSSKNGIAANGDIILKRIFLNNSQSSHFARYFHKLFSKPGFSLIITLELFRRYKQDFH